MNNNMQLTVLLTGATGFLGSHLVEELLKKGYSVVALKRSTSNIWRIEHLVSKIVLYDIDTVTVETVFKNQHIDIVIHTATSYGRNNESIEEIIQTNILFPIHLLECAALFNVEVFLNTDTLSLKDINNYALSKKQFAQWLPNFSNKLKIVNLRLEHMYGTKDDKNKFIYYIIEQLKNNVQYIDLTEGSQKRDFIYISDVVNVYMLMLNKYKNFENFTEFDVGTGVQVSVRDFVTTIYAEMKKKHKFSTVLNFGAVPYRIGEPMEVNENIQPLFDLGWTPRFFFKAGIQYIINEV